MKCRMRHCLSKIIKDIMVSPNCLNSSDFYNSGHLGWIDIIMTMANLAFSLSSESKSHCFVTGLQKVHSTGSLNLTFYCFCDGQCEQELLLDIIILIECPKPSSSPFVGQYRKLYSLVNQIKPMLIESWDSATHWCNIGWIWFTKLYNSLY